MHVTGNESHGPGQERKYERTTVMQRNRHENKSFKKCSQNSPCPNVSECREERTVYYIGIREKKRVYVQSYEPRGPKSGSGIDNTTQREEYYRSESYREESRELYECECQETEK